MKLYCATTNAGKLREFRLAAGLGVEIATLNLTGIAAPEETGATFEENASLKALYYARYAPSDGLLFAEDSGLEVDALGGAPGIYSARFAGADATDRANNERLLERLAGQANRRARYVCVIAVAPALAPALAPAPAPAPAPVRGIQAVFRGEMEGEILTAARGVGGFGYDPLFYYPPFACTLAEVATERTFECSHRRRALDQLFAWLRRA